MNLLDPKLIVCYKWPIRECIIHPVTDSWELVEMRMLNGKPCAVVKKKKLAKSPAIIYNEGVR